MCHDFIQARPRDTAAKRYEGRERRQLASEGRTGESRVQERERCGANKVKVGGLGEGGGGREGGGARRSR